MSEPALDALRARMHELKDLAGVLGLIVRELWGAAAIANAVFNATGKRVRDLPITPDKLV